MELLPWLGAVWSLLAIFRMRSFVLTLASLTLPALLLKVLLKLLLKLLLLKLLLLLGKCEIGKKPGTVLQQLLQPKVKVLGR